MNIVELNWKATLPIRHEVLWPNKPMSFCKVEGDESALHFGIHVDNTLACVASLYIEGNIARLRKFATLSRFQHQGLGSAMLQHLLDAARQRGIHHFWFDARESAMAFYAKFGFMAEGDRFFKGEVPYFKMSKVLDPAD